MSFILAMYVGVGLLFVLLGMPMAARRVPPNPWYGFRVEKTTKPGNEHIWYEANAYQGRLMIRVGALVAGGAVLLGFVKGMTQDVYALACTAILLLGCIVMLVLSFRYLATLK